MKVLDNFNTEFGLRVAGVEMRAPDPDETGVDQANANYWHDLITSLDDRAKDIYNEFDYIVWNPLGMTVVGFSAAAVGLAIVRLRR